MHPALPATHLTILPLGMSPTYSCSTCPYNAFLNSYICSTIPFPLLVYSSSDAFYNFRFWYHLISQLSPYTFSSPVLSHSASENTHHHLMFISSLPFIHARGIFAQPICFCFSVRYLHATAFFQLNNDRGPSMLNSLSLEARFTGYPCWKTIAFFKLPCKTWFSQSFLTIFTLLSFNMDNSFQCFVPVFARTVIFSTE